jgi:hypothetical protein
VSLLVSRLAAGDAQCHPRDPHHGRRLAGTIALLPWPKLSRSKRIYVLNSDAYNISEMLIGGLRVAQRITGLYRLITIPAIHRKLMFSLGADSAIARYVEDVLQPKADMKMLDVGCGPANVLA